MKRYEMRINILDKNYIDSLIVALVRNGNSVYFNSEENVVCYTVSEEDIEEINL